MKYVTTRFIQILGCMLLLLPVSLHAQEEILNLNKPEREAWFSEQGFGMFIHWSVDVELGSVISHSLVGASEDYTKRYFEELPKTFNPKAFDPENWAKLAKLAGMRYVMFTTKHHNGFCMYDTKTTDYNIMNTPFGRDATREVFDAFRKEGIAIGVYFSPDDFHFLYEQGVTISRVDPKAKASGNQELNAFAKKQLRELLKNYGKVDLIFLDGMEQYAETELAKVAWSMDPDIVVTRGVMHTPEQNTPNEPMPAPWEACYTMGTQWQYKPTNETYKSGKDIIEQLIEIRAKGGNWLLNVGPKPDGSLPIEQEERLREVALWQFVNGESIHEVESWGVIREGNIWFTKKKNQNTVYAIITKEAMPFGKRKAFTLNSIKAGPNTKISVLGQNGKVLEYAPNTDPSPKILSTEGGLTISVMRSQRLYNDQTWPNPVVVKIEGVEFQNP
jgi:alpha-L-fucosidase